MGSDAAECFRDGKKVVCFDKLKPILIASSIVGTCSECVSFKKLLPLLVAPSAP